MQWLVEHMGATDDNDSALLRTFSETGRSHVEIKQIPFTSDLILPEGFNASRRSLIYGSTKIVDTVSHRPDLNVETFHGEGWFDPMNWVGMRSDLLNESATIITVKDLRSNWVINPTFVKSINVKLLNGMVLYPDKHDKDTWLIEHSHLEGRDLLIQAPVHKIEREWRFFVVEGEVVTGSTYRRDGCRTPLHPVSREAWAAADRATKEWMPSPNIVIDIARTWAGEYKVIEFNCISSSGFYNSDVPKLVDRLEEFVRKA